MFFGSCHIGLVSIFAGGALSELIKETMRVSLLQLKKKKIQNKHLHKHGVAGEWLSICSLHKKAFAADIKAELENTNCIYIDIYVRFTYMCECICLTDASET